MQPYQKCPSFNVCSCNICPLDPDWKDKNRLPEDDKCTAQKPTRTRIGEKYAQVLPMKGLTGKEYGGLKAWVSLGTEKQNEITQQGVKALKVAKNRL